MTQWSERQPLYQQIRDRLIAMILDGTLQEGESVPSVRQMALDWQINHLTVLKGLQLLVQAKLLDKQRGKSFTVAKSARDNALNLERDIFIEQEWPALKDKLKKLQLASFVHRELKNDK